MPITGIAARPVRKRRLMIPTNFAWMIAVLPIGVTHNTSIVPLVHSSLREAAARDKPINGNSTTLAHAQKVNAGLAMPATLRQSWPVLMLTAMICGPTQMMANPGSAARSSHVRRRCDARNSS